MKSHAQPHETVKKVAGALGKYGRGGDNIVAHINPREAEMLKARGGAGTVNPHTGLLEFYYDQSNNGGQYIGYGGADMVYGPNGNVGAGTPGYFGVGAAPAGYGGAKPGAGLGDPSKGPYGNVPGYMWLGADNQYIQMPAGLGMAPNTPAAAPAAAPQAAPAAAPSNMAGQGYTGSYHVMGPAGAAGMDPLGDPMTRGASTPAAAAPAATTTPTADPTLPGTPAGTSTVMSKPDGVAPPGTVGPATSPPAPGPQPANPYSFPWSPIGPDYGAGVQPAAAQPGYGASAPAAAGQQYGASGTDPYAGSHGTYEAPATSDGGHAPGMLAGSSTGTWSPLAQTLVDQPNSGTAGQVNNNLTQAASNPASGTVGGATSGTANALQSAASPTSATPIGQASNLGAANPAANPTGTTGASGTSAAGSPTSPAAGGQPGGNDLLSMFLANQNTSGMYG